MYYRLQNSVPLFPQSSLSMTIYPTKKDISLRLVEKKKPKIEKKISEQNRSGNFKCIFPR